MGLRAAAVAGDHRREVGVAEGVEVGRRELHRPPGVVPGTYGTRAGAGPGGAVAQQTEAQDGSWAWRERRGGRGSVFKPGPQEGNGVAVNQQTRVWLPALPWLNLACQPRGALCSGRHTAPCIYLASSVLT
jgi:hypothetical protein